MTELAIHNLDLYWKATSNEWHHKDGEHDFYELQTDATIVSDFEHRIPHAIAVEIGGKVIGHLRHTDALRLHRRLIELGFEGIRSKCDANLVGRIGYWEVNLDLDTALPGTKAAAPESERL